ncbi:hypothetical protein ACX27_19170 [Nostoc piscinale CENA21]|uniref:Uncharacterized protein n=1 Tax=Nostoc piscinale CENA21 TaxID=224013 RepID=A0A0M3V5T7_9NOSO|nr:hypothetical protein ACX27_19170 [Nostoc piscinale CENA21]
MNKKGSSKTRQKEKVKRKKKESSYHKPFSNFLWSVYLRRPVLACWELEAGDWYFFSALSTK